jgi:multiple antibiotic resistance protein
MLDLLKPYISTFIPIFAAVDALGNIPIFIALTNSLNKKHKRKVIQESVITATVIAVVFMFLGKALLRLLGITVADFQIAGGILLLVIAIHLLLSGKRKGSALTEAGGLEVGIFPLGTPLVTGPAVLTMTLMMVDSFGTVSTFIAIVLNMFIVWLTFRYADFFVRLMSEPGMKAFAKIMYILLAAIAVMMMRRGIMGVLLSL